MASIATGATTRIASAAIAKLRRRELASAITAAATASPTIAARVEVNTRVAVISGIEIHRKVNAPDLLLRFAINNPIASAAIN